MLLASSVVNYLSFPLLLFFPFPLFSFPLFLSGSKDNFFSFTLGLGIVVAVAKFEF